MLNRTRRLLGLAKTTSSMPDWDDPRSLDGFSPLRPNWLEPPEDDHPDWKDDLESLFKHVDSRLAERRAVVSLPPDGIPERRSSGDRRAPAPSAQAPPPIAEAAPPVAVVESGSPKHLWLGFGLEDEVPAAAEEPGPVEQLAGEVVTQLRATLLDGDMSAAVREAVRDAVEDALRDRLAEEVRAGVEAALRAEAARRSSERISPSTIVAIRVRQRGWRETA